MLETICTDFAISKKLKELGFKADTNFLYTPTMPMDKLKLELQHWENKHLIAWQESAIVPAYTLEQIINELPLKIGGYGYFSVGVRQNQSNKPWCIGYNLENNDDYGVYYCDNLDNENLANTAAKLWIKLKEEKII